MSRIDDNSDEQRIRDMQQSELRSRKDRDSREANNKVTKSFEEVMRERGAKPAERTQAKKTNEQSEAAAKQKSFAEALLKKGPASSAELAKRAAMSRAAQQGMTASRSAEQQKLREADNDRSEDLVKRLDDEKERIDHDVREADDASFKQAEERDAIFKKVDPDGENRERSNDREKGRGQRDGSDGEKPKAEAVEAAANAKGAAGAKTIPPEIIEKLVSAIYKAVSADGRTEMQVELKGGMLEGVRLKISSNAGKVQCSFEGCDKELRNLIESSKGALQRGLSKRGLTLTSISAK